VRARGSDRRVAAGFRLLDIPPQTA